MKTNSQIMTIEHIPQTLLDEFTQVVQSMAPIHSIYLLGATKEEKASTYFLRDKNHETNDCRYEFIVLIVSHNEIWGTQDFMDSVYKKMNERVRVFSIQYSHSHLLTRIDEGDIFLARIMRPENVLYQESLIEEMDPGSKFSYLELIDEWKARINRAEYFQTKAHLLDEVDDETARMELISQMVFHGSAALLCVHWQFRPQHFDLEVLLKLCGMVSKSPETLLPENSYSSTRIFEYLKNAHYNLQFRTDQFIHYEDSDEAFERAGRFLNQVFEEGEAILGELKNEQNPPQKEKDTTKVKKNNSAGKKSKPKKEVTQTKDDPPKK